MRAKDDLRYSDLQANMASQTGGTILLTPAPINMPAGTVEPPTGGRTLVPCGCCPYLERKRRHRRILC